MLVGAPAALMREREALAAFLRRVLLRVEAFIDDYPFRVEKHCAENVWVLPALARHTEPTVGVVELDAKLSAAIYHAIDPVAEEEGKRAAHLRQLWWTESLEFKLVDVIAHHFKHVKSSDERIPALRPGLPIGLALGFNEAGDQMDLRNLYFVIRTR